MTLEEAEDLAAALAASLESLSLRGSTPGAAPGQEEASVAREAKEPLGSAAAASGPPPSTSRSTSSRAKAAARVVRSVQPAEDWCYVVWWVAERPDLVGIHVGPIRAWRALILELPGRAYCSSTCRLRRFENLAAGRRACEAERRHGAPADPRVFHY